MDPNFNKFLQRLESSKNTPIRQKPQDRTLTEEQLKQRNTEIAAIEKEIEVEQASLDAKKVDINRASQLYQRAKAVVKELEVADRHIHDELKEVSISEERAKNLLSNVTNLRPVVNEVICREPLQFDTTSLLNSFLDKATQSHNAAVGKVKDAAVDFDVQTVIMEISRTLDMRKKRNNTFLEKDALCSLLAEANNNFETQKEVHADLLTEIKSLRANLKKIEGKTDDWASKIIAVNEKKAAVRLELANAQNLVKNAVEEEQKKAAQLERGAVELSQLVEDSSALEKRIVEIESRIAQIRSGASEHRKSLEAKYAKEFVSLRADVETATRRRDQAVAAARSAQDEIDIINSIQEAFARRDAGADDDADEIAALEADIKKAKDNVEDHIQRKQFYKTSLEDRLGAKQAEVEKRQSNCEVMQEMVRSTAEELRAVDAAIQLKEREIQGDASVMEIEVFGTPPQIKLEPLSTSTPLPVTEKAPAKAAAPKRKASAKRGNGARRRTNKKS